MGDKDARVKGEAVEAAAGEPVLSEEEHALRKAAKAADEAQHDMHVLAREGLLAVDFSRMGETLQKYKRHRDSESEKKRQTEMRRVDTLAKAKRAAEAPALYALSYTEMMRALEESSPLRARL